MYTYKHADCIVRHSLTTEDEVLSKAIWVFGPLVYFDHDDDVMAELFSEQLEYDLTDPFIKAEMDSVVREWFLCDSDDWSDDYIFGLKPCLVEIDEDEQFKVFHGE